jgi:uncharacterized protein YndB with AHSA1/START domain
MRRIRAGVAVLAAILALPLHAEVKDAAPGGFTVENSAVVQASPERVWAVMIDEVDQWWPKDHSWWGSASRLSIDPRAGGCFCETAGGQQAQHLQVVFVDPARTLRMTGGLGPLQGMGLHGVAEWTLKAEGGNTRVTWRYRAGGYTPDDLSGFAAIVDKVQAQQLDGLVQRVKAGNP